MNSRSDRSYTLWIAGLILTIAAVIAILFLYSTRLQQSIIRRHELSNRMYHTWVRFKESVYDWEGSADARRQSREVYTRFSEQMEELRSRGGHRSTYDAATPLEKTSGAVELEWQMLSNLLAPHISALSGDAGRLGRIRNTLRSPLGTSFEENLRTLEQLTFARTDTELHRLRLMSYAIMIVMAFFVFGFLSFLIAGRERFQGEKRVRRLTQSLLKRIEDERKQVSFDLHEVVVQDLASIKMQCQNLLEDIRSGRGAPEETVSTLVNELGELIGVTRGITGTLKPRRLDHFGLTGTIKALCNDLSASSDLDVRFHSVGLEAIEIDYDTEINIYRIAQELLRYIRKYSRAERTSVKLISSSPYLYLRISDDGNGINPFKQRVELRTAPEEQLRLITVEERVRMLEGTITIQAVPGRGTEFKIGIPIEQSSKGSTDETPGSEER